MFWGVNNPNVQALQAYEEDQKRKKKEKEEGKVRYVEAAKASRVQYSIPGGYKGKSRDEGSKTYQWEKDFLKNAKIKGVRSYNDRFDVMAKQMGMTPGQAEDFRNYMDWQEDSQHVDPKMNKDGKINQQQSLKYARDTHLETDIIDGILDNMTKTAASKVKKYQETPKKAPEKKDHNKFVDGLMKVMEIIDRPGDAVRTGIKEKAEGRGFWEGAKDGFTGEKNTSGTELNKLIGLDPEKNEKQRRISEVINSNILNTSGIGMAINAFAPDKAKEYAATQTPGAATETLLDPLNLVGGAATKAPRKGAELLSRLARVEGELPTYSGNVTDSVLDLLAPNARQANKIGNSPSDDLYAQLLGQETPKPKPQTKADAWNSFKPDEIPAVEEPASFLDELLYGQQGNGPRARGAIDQVNLPRYAKDNISDMGTNILNQADQLQNAPEGGYNQRVLDVQNEMRIKEAQDAAETAQQAFDQRDMLEQDFVSQYTAPFRETAEQQANAQAKWENVVKKAQKDASHIKQTFGKIHVPKGAAEDYPIPPQFRAAYGDKASDDIFSFADQMGFSSADEAVQYLQKLDQDSKVKLKDMMPGAPEPEPKNLQELVNYHGHKDVTPETIADSYNKKQWYHGTGAADLTPDKLDPLVGNHEGLFGHGVYLTDSPEIAKGYSKSRGKRTSTPTTYETNVKMDRVLDLEKPISNDAKSALDKFAKPLDYQYKRSVGDENYFSSIIEDMSKKGATTEDIIQRMRQEIKDFSHEEGIPTSEFVENFQDLTIYLKQHGYDGITHTGGGRTGHDAHRVLIALDPNDGYAQTGRTNQITNFKPNDPDELIKRVNAEGANTLSADDWNTIEKEGRKAFADTDHGKAIDQLIADLLDPKNKSNFDALYNITKNVDDPATFDELVKLAELENNAKPVERNIKAMLRDDPRVAEKIKGLNALGGTKAPQAPGLNGNYGQGNLQGIDDVLALLGENSKNVNNSQAPEQVLEQLVRPKKAETEAVNPAPVSEEVAAGVQPETSSNMKPLGITAGQPKANDISWVEDPQSFIDKVKSGKENAGTVKRKLKTEVISDLQPVKDVERSIAAMDEDGVLDTILGDKTNVSAEDSLFKGLRGVRRSVSEAMKAAKDDYGTILKTLRTNKISKRDFDEYVSAVHFNDVLKNNQDLMVKAGEVDEQLALNEKLAQGTTDKETLKDLAKGEKELLQMKKELEPYKLPASATNESVERVLKRWENTPAMKEAQKAFMDAQNKDLDLLVQSGVYTQSTADAMRTAHPNYIYMGRAKEEASLLGAGGNSSKPNKFILKRSKGSEENLKYSPLESAVRNRLLTFSNARRNQAMQQIEKLAGVKGAEQYFSKLNPHTASASQMRNSVKFFVDGAEQRYEVPPALKDAFDNIDAKNAKDLVSSSLRAVANVTRKGATYFNTDFIFSSPFRDANGLITSRTNMHPGELILGYMDSFMGKGLERMSGGKFKSYKGLYEKMGGHQTGFVTLDPQSTKQFMKDMDKGTLGKGIKIIDPRKWPEVITKFGGAIEHGPKLGEFRSAKNKGLGDADAMHEATEVIDYTDQGSTIRNWNDKIPFLNPAIRGNTRYFQAAKENFPAWMGKNLLYVTTPTVGIYMMRFSPTTSDGQRSKLRNMSEYQKNMFWHIPVPGTENILSIPKMHTAAQLFGNPIERALDLAFEDNPKSISRILKDTGADSLNVLVPPSAVAGVNQLKNAIANYDPLMDMPIEDLAMQKNPNKEERYNSFTSEVAKGLGKTFNQSPAKIDYILKSLTGGTGRDILDVTDNALAKTGLADRPQKVDTILDILNPARRYQYKDTSGLETSNELYEQQKRDTFEGKDSDAVRLYSDMKALNKEIKGIRESKDMSSQEKKEAIAELRVKQRSIGDEAIKLGILKNR